ncbi:ketopantoate reductase family protein [Isoptericola jiangsuensis]|uniref:ketopantoate reductase family protein n=1 Tax=Isoptericola jiangsuensis TaxID=548579 RepID=UPI003AAFAB9C
MSTETVDARTIAVVGPGAVGCLVAGFLHRAGADVVLVGRPRTVDRLGAGLRVVTDSFGTWDAPVPASTTIPTGASVLVTVKAGDWTTSSVRSPPPAPWRWSRSSTASSTWRRCAREPVPGRRSPVRPTRGRPPARRTPTAR